MSILSAKNIVKRYASHTALNGVSIDVPHQCIFGLLGPNGAGKTSLIRIINQITGPDDGTLLFEGEPLAAEHTELIGYLPEERGLYKKMTVGDQAMYLAQLKGLPKREAKTLLKEWFKKFNIDNWWDKKVEELSKGMQQKVQFIVTILHKPKLIILDEPFSGFDPINTNLIKNEILKLKEQGCTIIFSTHNMGSVEELCDHIALINKSEKVLDGPVQEIRDAFKNNTYEIKFKGSTIAFANALWTGAKVLEQSTEADLNIVKIQLANNVKVNDILGAILGSSEIVSVNEVIPSMNDIFISAVEAKSEETETKTENAESHG